jgi:hypothetical protein
LSLAAPGRPNGANLTMRPVGEGGSDDLPMAHQLPGAICGARRAATPRMCRPGGADRWRPGRRAADRDALAVWPLWLAGDRLCLCGISRLRPIRTDREMVGCVNGSPQSAKFWQLPCASLWDRHIMRILLPAALIRRWLLSGVDNSPPTGSARGPRLTSASIMRTPRTLLLSMRWQRLAWR